MKISILIPVHNFDVVALVSSLNSGMESVKEFCELIIGDDGSTEEFRKQYLSLADDRIKVIVSEKNIGRAAIRNKLVLEAAGDYLLFIDADAMIPSTAVAYLSNWLEHYSVSRVICGGVLYGSSQPGDPDKLLRWSYGVSAEQKKAEIRIRKPYARFSTFNVLMDKSIFSKLRFYEDLKQYGFEDILLGYQLKKAGIPVLHIDNGLIHEGIETNKEFLIKTKYGIENLSRLYDNVTDRRTFTSIVFLLRIYRILRFLQVTRPMAALFIKFRDRMEIRLDSAKPSLTLFEFYKISMFCTYREIHRRRKILPIFNIPPDAI